MPIALVFGYGVSWLNSGWFLGGTVFGYWLSNVIGMVMMQFGVMDVVLSETPRNLLKDSVIGCGSATLCTVLIAGLMYFHVLETPEFLPELLAGLHP